MRAIAPEFDPLSNGRLSKENTMAPRILASIDILTDLTLDEVTTRVGLAPSTMSHQKGASRPRGRKWDKTVWRLESGIDEAAPLSEHLRALLERFPTLAAGTLPADITVIVNLAIVCPGPACSATIAPELVRCIADRGFTLDLTVYFGEEEQRQPVGDARESGEVRT